MAMPDGYPKSSIAESLLRDISCKMSQNLSLTVQIEKGNNGIFRGIIDPMNKVMPGITIHFIADHRLFHVKFVVSKDVDNFSKKNMLVKRNYYRFLISYGEMNRCVTNGDVNFLAHRISKEIFILSKDISQR